jgi:hypothetical protein
VFGVFTFSSSLPWGSKRENWFAQWNGVFGYKMHVDLSLTSLTYCYNPYLPTLGIILIYLTERTLGRVNWTLTGVEKGKVRSLVPYHSRHTTELFRESSVGAVKRGQGRKVSLESGSK